MLKKNEVAYLQSDVRLLETRKIRHYESGFGGVRVAKGIYIGATKGRSVSTDELTEIDQGSLILTNQRVIFDGKLNSRDIKLDKLLSIDQYSDGIEIAIEGWSKGQVYIDMDNPFLWVALIKVVRQIPETGELPPIMLGTEQ